LVKAEQTERVPGSGIDLQAFPATPMPEVDADQPIRFLMVARLLRDKGVMEYVEAARLLRAMNIPASFELLGFLDTCNPSAISRQQLEAWQLEGAIRYHGSTDDVRPFIADAHCVVLPSYREGVPRTLLEAASMARPLIATDAVGCRDAVDDAVNGFLVRPRDASDLAEKCLRFISLSDTERVALGSSSREKVEREFDEKLVISTYLSLLRSIRNDCPTANVSL
jgi:glycosyltransferase involved in cell wall biosynthesis